MSKRSREKGKIYNKYLKYLSFLTLLEDQAINRNNSPILIIRKVQKLVDNPSIDSNELFSTLFTCFEQYKEGTKNVSVIIESAVIIEYLWSDLKRQIRTSPESFKAYQVKLWSKEEGLEELVNTMQIFTNEEYEKVGNAVGCHPGQLFDLHFRTSVV